MQSRTVLTALGAGITTLLLVSVLGIELIPVEFSALVALPLGVVAGLGAVVLVLGSFDQLNHRVQHTVVAVAGFGYTILALSVVSYVNLAGLRSAITVERALALALGVAVALYVDQWLTTRRTAA
jgi:hypothetical protein